MGSVVNVSATARHFIAGVIEQNGGDRAMSALEPKVLRRLIRQSFCLGEACKCDKQVCVCMPCEKRVGLKYRKNIWVREFKKMLRKAPNAYLNSALAQTPF
jgi:hypothetical protein